ncbi:MAG: beta/gamma crystallin-related protein [Rhizomicrobium sp.]
MVATSIGGNFHAHRQIRHPWPALPVFWPPPLQRSRPHPAPALSFFKKTISAATAAPCTKTCRTSAASRFDDRVSSLEVRRGVWELCEHAYYRGRCITMDHDVAKLSRLGFDDRTTSIRRIH